MTFRVLGMNRRPKETKSDGRGDSLSTLPIAMPI